MKIIRTPPPPGAIPTAEGLSTASPGDAAPPTAAPLPVRAQSPLPTICLPRWDRAHCSTGRLAPGPVPPPADVGAGEADGRPEGGADRQPHGSRLMTHAPAAAPRPRGVHHTSQAPGGVQVFFHFWTPNRLDPPTHTPLWDTPRGVWVYFSVPKATKIFEKGVIFSISRFFGLFGGK